MTERQRLMAVLREQTPDQTPWYGDLTYYYRSLDTRGLLRDEYQGAEGETKEGGGKTIEDLRVMCYIFEHTEYEADYAGFVRTDELWGGVPGAMFTPMFSDEQFDAHVKGVLEVFPPGSRFVLGVADQVPPDGLSSRIKRVRELVEELS